MTDEELLALYANTTPGGAWLPNEDEVDVVTDQEGPVGICTCHGYDCADNAKFIAAAHNELPRLIAEKRALAEQRDAANGIITSLAELLGSKIETLPSMSERVHQLHARIRELTEPQPETTAPRDGTRILGKRWALNRYESVSFSAGEFRDRFGDRVLIDGWIPSPEVTP